MKNKTAVTFLIPTYTNASGLKKLLNSLSSLKQQIVVVDNKPDAEKRELSTKQNILYLPQKKNLGFSRAINLAAKKAGTEWLVILNDDIEIKDTGIFEEMIGYAVKNNLGTVSPVLKNSQGQIENLGYRVLPIGKVELNFDKDREIDGLTAACLLIKKAVFEKVEGFDERFFAYLEDVDLFLGLKKVGEKFGICYTTEVIHNHMTTSSKMGNFKQKQDVVNWIKIIMKDWDKNTLIKYLPGILLERTKNIFGYLKSVKAR
ncbi:MAG: glycosyltransferase [Patescibacteria group bacterium]|nr:glycosyltransferase [Patescibacteria group bacterium]